MVVGFPTPVSGIRALVMMNPSHLLPRQLVQRTPDLTDRGLADMRVPFGGPNITVPEKFLNIPNVHAVFKQMRGERMAQGVERCPLANPRLL